MAILTFEENQRLAHSVRGGQNHNRASVSDNFSAHTQPRWFFHSFRSDPKDRAAVDRARGEDPSRLLPGAFGFCHANNIREVAGRMVVSEDCQPNRRVYSSAAS